MTIEEKIAEIIGNSNTYVYAFANLEGLLDDRYAEFSNAISIARKLDDDSVDGAYKGPTIRYMQEYKDINTELSALVLAVSNMLFHENIKNAPVKPTFEDHELDENYFKTLRTEFSHKMAATRAGLGWIGKTDLLVTFKFGPRVRLAMVLVDYQFQKTGIPITASKCGACTVCVDKCPAQAANGMLWETGIDRNDFYDAFKCREKCRELSKINLNETISLCGICVSACPIGK
jgi:epoxyqueuosine reductase QueG